MISDMESRIRARLTVVMCECGIPTWMAIKFDNLRKVDLKGFGCSEWFESPGFIYGKAFQELKIEEYLYYPAGAVNKGRNAMLEKVEIIGTGSSHWFCRAFPSCWSTLKVLEITERGSFPPEGIPGRFSCLTKLKLAGSLSCECRKNMHVPDSTQIRVTESLDFCSTACV
eukprot:GHVU01091430.1.p1 GENE.GHVU01091430.1~~GHVU01091430.1.p1  ORF type:complete len:170 (+),score=11.17 GHVU01091430.1:707-1216(+)